MKTKMKLFVPLFSILICLIACNDDDDPKKTVDFSLIGKGELYGNGAEGITQSNLVITNTETWSQLMLQIDSVNPVTDDFEETDIDFDAYQVLAVFDKIYGYGGHSIDITKVMETNTGIVVTVKNIQPGGDNPIVTQPFHIVKIPKSEKPVVFE